MSHLSPASLARCFLPVSIGCCLALPVGAQVEAPPSHRVAQRVDSLTVSNTSTDPALQNVAVPVWSRIVTVPNAHWVRLYYHGVLLAGDQQGGRGSYLKITSLTDGYFQTQHGVHVSQWENTSANFNGDSVLVELFAYPGTGDNRFVLDEVEAGDAPPFAGAESICGATDDRVASSDPRAARLSTGCTSWLIDDCEHCLLTAGHCGVSGSSTIYFNVPLSSSSGSLQYPPPSDQYSVDSASIQSNGGQGIGNDWAYFGVFPNSTTGMTAAQSQGQWFVLASSPPPVMGQQIRITGYGSTSSPVSPTLNQAQKTHVGPYYSFSGTTVRYTTDTTGGNSGSPVIDESSGMAIGIHTHAGCDPANHGTGINHAALQAALANPLGVCLCPGLSFTYPSGIPASVLPAGGTTFRVVVGPDSGNVPLANTGLFHYDQGAGFVSVPMAQVSPNVYDATFPPTPCGADVRFYVSAQATNGTRYTDPVNAPTGSRAAFSVVALNTLIAYDFNTPPPNWSVASVTPLTGAWVRVVPAGNNGSRRDPSGDYDGSGACWVTGNASNEDVDDGPTTLTTEVFDLSAALDPYVSFARWYKNDDGDDPFAFEISQNGGSSWTLVEQTIGDTPTWEVRRVRILDHVTALSQVAFRWRAQDLPNDSVTEAAIDAFELVDRVCVSASWRAFGVGCAGTVGPPQLVATSLPRSGSTFTTEVQLVPPGAAVWGTIGFSDTLVGSLPLPVDLGLIGMSGCSLYHDLEISVPLNPIGGAATFSVAIPSAMGLIGNSFFEQAFVLDPGANAFGLTSTNAGEATVGQ